MNQDLIATCPSNSKAIKISLGYTRSQEYSIQEPLLKNLLKNEFHPNKD